MDFDKFNKAKYQLNVGGYIVYSFVTTAHSESECIELLKEKSETHRGSVNKWFTITKKSENKKEVLFRGKILALKN